MGAMGVSFGSQSQEEVTVLRGISEAVETDITLLRKAIETELVG